MIEKVFDCDVDYDKFTIDGIKYPADEFSSRTSSLENMDFDDYEWRTDELYDTKYKKETPKEKVIEEVIPEPIPTPSQPKKKTFFKTIIPVYKKDKMEIHVE